MSMKTILVPMEPHEGMGAVLETALLLAKKHGSYIEGFPLRFGISEFVAVDPAGSIPLESYRQESQEEAAQARKLFDSFMQQRGVPRSSGASRRAVLRLARGRARGRELRRQLRAGVRHHRAEPARHQHHRAAQPRDRVRPVRERPADPVVAAGAAEGHRDQRHDPLELQHRAGPRHGGRHAAAAGGGARHRAHGCGRAGRAGTDRRAIAHASAAQRHRGEADDGGARGQKHAARRSCGRPRRKAATCWSRAPSPRAGCGR